MCRGSLFMRSQLMLTAAYWDKILWVLFAKHYNITMTTLSGFFWNPFNVITYNVINTYLLSDFISTFFLTAQ